ncbi:hypothetical protein Ait01nite_000830 [Actinoplanes italicus]|uniref:Uncharacterized protein n=1 Tax=Actinoplanes italicus TaxID=113567 RepID=A0A2T0KDK4_9ACTN|nr:hypothetical protein [Actinoplanes italicus]PRX21359.1 hypothetical protein CLV67_106139 [Actinoplanes italicus]GIE27038.1 hypothetical protein Ait01nite_000830 [Actinoplanes italicus]
MTRSLVREDPFSGEARPSLRAIDRDLDAVIVDAQSRDWAADRPDRVIFARLGQARHQVRAAAGRRTGSGPVADRAAILPGTAVGILVAGATAAAVGDPATRPLPLALIAVAGLWTALITVAGLRFLQRRRDTFAGPAPIDDHYRYAAFRRRIETRAADARSHRSQRRRATAIDLEYALDWLAAAQSELPRR